MAGAGALAGGVPGALPGRLIPEPPPAGEDRFTADPLNPLDLVGSVRLELLASASTPDADFTAKLTDIAPDGTARYICDGILRARYRNGLDSPALLPPDELCWLEIPMYAGHRLEAGHRLGLEVAGSCFPKYSRNLHHGGSYLHSGPETALPSHRVVALGWTRLMLPVIR